jgi:serine/threonine protein kinase
MSAEIQAGGLVGTVLGGAYRITRLIGEGGMGSVYEALHLRLDKRVAVKLMARELASNEEALVRFNREAGVASHLGHPHLVNVIDFGTSESGEPFLVMEYLDGEDLDHRIRRVGRLSLGPAVEITKQVAGALAAAHAQGIVHRDLKPANIYLVQVPGEADFVKVLDFGVSKIKAVRTKLTRASTMLGTPEYMSPEQATGLVDEIDHRADQWSLGCIAWEMLSGRAPFNADDTSALFYQVINLDPQPLASRVPDLPPGVEVALRQALAKRPADRFPSIKDFARALEAAAYGLPIDVTPTPVTLSQTPGIEGVMGQARITPATSAVNRATGQRAGISGDGVAASLLASPAGRGRLVYIILIVAAVLLAGGFFLARSLGTAPTLTTTPVKVLAPTAPVVRTFPATAVEPSAAPAPVPVVPPRPETSARPSRSKLGKTSVPADSVPTGFAPKSAGGKRSGLDVDPFESARARPKTPEPSRERKPPKPRKKRQIFQEL